jgi:hypothetical protein
MNIFCDLIVSYFHSKPAHEVTKHRCLELLLRIILEYAL